MNVPNDTKTALWGVAGGAIIVVSAGFSSWGGWTTAASAASSAQSQSNKAVVAALAPVCADKFRRAPDAGANLGALRKVEPGAQGEFVEKGGWAAVPGNNSAERVSEVARTCAELLLTTS